MPAVINDDALQLGPCNLYKSTKTPASLITALTGTDNDIALKVKPRYFGVIGNSITLEIVNAGAAFPLVVTVAGTAISVQAETVASVIVTTADELIAALNADPTVSSLLYAVRKSGDDGSGVITVLVATPLTGGSETLIEEFLGALGEETAVTIVTEAAPLTAAQSGTLARKKVIIGGKLSILAPLKEMTLERFADACGNAELLVGDGVDPAKRLEFKVNVGQDLRASRSMRLVLRRLIGANQESPDPDDTLTIPSASPVDAEVELAYNPTTQRQVNATFEAWPDARGVLAYFGADEGAV